MRTFSDLYERRADYMFFLCTRLESDEERVDLIFQDVWRRIHRQFPQLEGSREEMWLCRKLVDSHRHLQSKWRGFDRLGEDTTAHSWEARLGLALTSLNLEYRWPLVFREFAGFDYAALAQILDIPERTVKARLGSARAMLARAHEELI